MRLEKEVHLSLLSAVEPAHARSDIPGVDYVLEPKNGEKACDAVAIQREKLIKPRPVKVVTSMSRSCIKNCE